jgi:uracil-DNA glycosylase family 4
VAIAVTADPDPPYPDSEARHAVEPGCRRCPDLVDSRTRISWGNGPGDADLLIVGEAPGAGDPDADRWQGGNHTGMAYTARHSGRRIRRLVERLGYGDRTFYTNAVKCFPSDGSGSNREPTAEERANCRAHLAADVDYVDPAVVVPTGRHATASLVAFDGASLEGFIERVLEPVRIDALDVVAVPILHPSYQDVWIPRLGYDEPEYVAAIGRALEAQIE